MPVAFVSGKRLIYGAVRAGSADVYVCGPVLLSAFGAAAAAGKADHRSVRTALRALSSDPDDFVDVNRLGMEAVVDAVDCQWLPRSHCAWVRARLALAHIAQWSTDQATHAAAVALLGGGADDHDDIAGDSGSDDDAQEADQKQQPRERDCVASFALLSHTQQRRQLLLILDGLHSSSDAKHLSLCKRLQERYGRGRVPNISSAALATRSAAPISRAHERGARVWEIITHESGRMRDDVDPSSPASSIATASSGAPLSVAAVADDSKDEKKVGAPLAGAAAAAAAVPAAGAAPPVPAAAAAAAPAGMRSRSLFAMPRGLEVRRTRACCTCLTVCCMLAESAFLPCDRADGALGR
jgi:hypothetical protein